MTILPFEDKNFWDTLELFRQRPEKTLSFVDISLLHLSNFYTVETFDIQLRKAIKLSQRNK